jgi:hypothetical protein
MNFSTSVLRKGVLLITKVFIFIRLSRITGALTLRPPTNWPCNRPTHMKRQQNFLSTVTIYHYDTFYCDIRPKVYGLFVHPKKWTVRHSMTFWTTVILANTWLWHFVHFWFWFLLGLLPLKILYHEISGIWTDWSIRFSDPLRTAAQDVQQFKGLERTVTNVPPDRTPPTHGSARLVPYPKLTNDMVSHTWWSSTNKWVSRACPLT